MKVEISPAILALPEFRDPIHPWIGHFPLVVWMIEQLQPRNLVFVGVHGHGGYFGCCQAVTSLGLATRCHGLVVGGSDVAGSDVLRDHDTRYRAFSTVAPADGADAQFADGSVDLLVIDTSCPGAPDPESTFKQWLPKLSASSVVVLHGIEGSEDRAAVRFWRRHSPQLPSIAFPGGIGLGLLITGADPPPTLARLAEEPLDELNAFRNVFRNLGDRCLTYVAPPPPLPEEVHASRDAVNHLMSVVSGLHAEFSAFLALRGFAETEGPLASSQRLLDDWIASHGSILAPADLSAHRSQAAWKTALRILSHIRRHHWLKPLACREFFNQVKGIAETAENLMNYDAPGAAMRYLEASRIARNHLVSQRKTWWKRLFIRAAWVDTVSKAVQRAEQPVFSPSPSHEPAKADPQTAPEPADVPKLSRLETKYPGISVPRGISNARSLGSKLTPPKIVRRNDPGRPRMNFLFPDLDPDIVFGGYIAALEFAAAMSAEYDIRFVTTAYPLLPPGPLKEKFRNNPRIRPMLENASFAELRTPDQSLAVSPRDFFCSYSFWDGITAHHLARACGQKQFLSFCQEDESSFHSHDFGHAIARHSQSLPQFAIFNTDILRDFFRQNRIGVYRDGRSEGDANSIAFQHALVPVHPASLEAYASRKTRRILLYARPEDHAKRNLFEFVLLAVERFLAENRIPPSEVELVGVGSLEFKADLALASGHTLRLQPKLELGDYAASLASFDIGLSLMYAPHPSILPFEMAAAGLIVVTNTFGIRDEALLTGISRNIVPVEPSIEAIAGGLKTAWELSRDFPHRIRHSEFPWSRDWTESFPPAFMDRVRAAVGTIVSTQDTATHPNQPEPLQPTLS